MSISIGSPVYCEDGPTQAATATEVKTQSAAQGANLYQDAGGPNVLSNPTVQRIISNSPYVAVPIGWVGIAMTMTHFQFGSAVPRPISPLLYQRNFGINLVGVAAGTIIGYNAFVRYGPQFGSAPRPMPNVQENVTEGHSALPVIERITPVQPVSIVKKEDLVAKFRSGNDAVNASNTVTDTDTHSIVRKYDISSVLEKGEDLNSQESILTFFTEWLKANHSNVLPSDLQNNLLDYFSSGLSFTSINIIVIVMYTAGCYLLFFYPTLLSLNYISHKFTSWTGVANIDKTGKSVIQVISSIIKLFIVILILVILVCSAYLYFYCNISLDVSNYINDTMKLELNQCTNITIKHKFMGGPTGISQTLWQTVLVLFLSFYRSMALIKPLVCDSNIKTIILVFSAICVKLAICFIIMTAVKIPTTSYNVVDLVDVFAGYNKCYKLVFYSTIIFLISNAIVYVINYYNKSKIVVGNYLNNQETKIAVNSKDYLFINLLMVFTKLCSYVALFGMFQGILFLKGYSIPCILDSYLTLY